MLTDNLGRLYMPKSNLLWMEVIHKHHDSPIARHPGYKKTLDLLQCNYYWPRMATTVKEYIARCDTCQIFKGSNMAQQAFYTHLKPHHYCGNISQPISSQTSPSPMALMQS